MGPPYVIWVVTGKWDYTTSSDYGGLLYGRGDSVLLVVSVADFSMTSEFDSGHSIFYDSSKSQGPFIF